MGSGEFFMIACLSTQSLEELQEKYKYRLSLPDKEKFRVSNKCRACQKLVNEHTIVVYVSYWTPHLWYPIHKECVEDYKKLETIWCQTIDADCNDCKFFERDKIQGDFKALFREIFPSIKGSKGYCSKRNGTVIACANHCSRFPCFEHRKQDELNQLKCGN